MKETGQWRRRKNSGNLYGWGFHLDRKLMAGVQMWQDGADVNLTSGDWILKVALLCFNEEPVLKKVLEYQVDLLNLRLWEETQENQPLCGLGLGFSTTTMRWKELCLPNRGSGMLHGRGFSSSTDCWPSRSEGGPCQRLWCIIRHSTPQ